MRRNEKIRKKRRQGRKRYEFNSKLTIVGKGREAGEKESKGRRKRAKKERKGN